MDIESKIEADLRAREVEERIPLVDDFEGKPFEVPERGRATWEVWLIALLVGAAAVNAGLMLFGMTGGF